MAWIECVCCEKLQRDFMARTFTFIAPVQYVLQQVSCSYETIPDAPKHYEMDWNISLGSNGVDWVRLLWKILLRLYGTNFALIAPVQPVLHRLLCSNETLPNTPKHYETHTNISLGSIGVDWVHSLWKILMRLLGKKFYINCTSSARFAPSFVQ